jgi:uncharacterized membrane protein YbhN (UPF0104 family)
MLNRLRSSPVIRTALLAAALAFCGIGIATDWPQVNDALASIHWYSVLGALLAAMAGAGCMMLAWRAILSDLGSDLPLPATVRVASVAQIAKYLPGAVWAFAAQVELGHDYAVPRRRSASAVIISLAVALATGLLLATATLPIASSHAAHRYWWIMSLAPLIALCLLPPVLRSLLDRAFALIRSDPLERPLTGPGLLSAVAWSLAGWAFWGVHAWLLTADLTGRGLGVLLLAAGSYAIAWSAGILLVVFPGGIGARELVLVAALAPVMPRGAALLLALTSRIVTTISEVTWAGVGLAAARITGHSRVRAGQAYRPPHVGKHRKATMPSLVGPGLAGPASAPGAYGSGSAGQQAGFS